MSGSSERWWQKESDLAAIQMTVVGHSRRPPFTPGGEEQRVELNVAAGLDFLCGRCERVLLARVAPKFALEHSFLCPHCGALNEAP